MSRRQRIVAAGSWLNLPVAILLAVVALAACGDPPVDSKPSWARDAREVQPLVLATDLCESLQRRSEPTRAEQFSAISGGVLHEDGFAVADRLAGRIYLVSVDGGVADSIGGHGDGPGEFRSIDALYGVDSTLLAWDGSRGRMSAFTLDGELVSEHSILPSATAQRGTRVFPAPGGGWTWMSRDFPARREGDFRDTVLLVVTPDGSNLDTLRVVPDRWTTGFVHEGGWRAIPHLLSAEVSIASSKHGVWLVDPEASWVGLWQRPGDLPTVVQVSRASTSDVSRAVDAARESLRRAVSASDMASSIFAGLVDGTPARPAIPALRGAAAGTNGTVWLLEWTVSGRGGHAWEVSVDGTTTRCMAIPDDGVLLDVAGTAVLLTTTDSLGRPEVTIWGLADRP